MKLLLKAQVREDQEDFQSTLDIMFEELEKKNPNHIAVRYYKIFKMGAGKTLKSILISCTVRLGTFNLKAVQTLTNTDTLNLMRIGDEPTALFVVIPSADTTFNYLVSMLYSQLFESLYFHAENECKGKRLPYHVRFLLDEFANIGTIPDFEKKLATMRKYEISCAIILQNLAQLKTLYKDAWESITGNCDTLLFLGGQEQTTLEYISKKLGKATILVSGYSRSRGGQGSRSESENAKGRDLMSPDEISRMDNVNCILFIRGLFPFFSKKFNYPRHPNYKFTGDADEQLLYRYRDPKRFTVPEDLHRTHRKTIIRHTRAELRQTGKDISHAENPAVIRRKRESAANAKGGKLVTPENLARDAGLPRGATTEDIASSFDLIGGFIADYEFRGAENYKSQFLGVDPDSPEAKAGGVPKSYDSEYVSSEMETYSISDEFEEPVTERQDVEEYIPNLDEWTDGNE